MIKLQLKQIGNGSAFNAIDCNSSFLVKMENDLMLFDCGYSVYPTLIKLDKKGEISLKNLSSGEKQILSLFSKLYLNLNNKNILLFDEPELSLSIIWLLIPLN